MKCFQKIALFLIILASFILRIWQVGRVPTFISDEASIGYNGYSILKTGKDEWGKLLPLSFKSFGEFKLPVYIYTTVPFIAVFDLSKLAVRLPSVLAGTFSLLLLFFLISRLFSVKIGLLTTFLVSISSWHFQASRMALEANLALVFVLLGVYFLTFVFEKRRFLYLSFFFFGLSLWTYNTCRVFVPLFLFFLFLSERKKWGNVLKKDWQAFLIILAFSLPIFLSGFQGSRQRLAKVGIFTDPGLIASVEQKRTECLIKSSALVCRFFYNRPLTWTGVFIENYLSHFSPKFLFTEGSGLSQYTIPKKGTLYLIELPFLLLGLYYLLIKSSKKSFYFLISWILTAPVANSFTGQAHPVRALVLLPVFSILSSLGIIFFLSFFKKNLNRFVGLVIFVIFLFSFAKFLNIYFKEYPYQVGSTWQEGYRLLFQKLAQKEDDFDMILITKSYGEPHIFYLFYRKIDPLFYLQDRSVIRYTRSDGWVNVDRIGKYYFFDKQIEVEGKVLFAITPEEKGENFEVLDQVTWKNGQISFLIGQPK